MNFSVHIAKEEVPSAIFILLCSSALEGGPGLLLVGPAMLQSNSVSVKFHIVPHGVALQEKASTA